MLENNYAWASYESGEPLRNVDLEDILGLKLFVRLNIHGPLPIVTSKALPEPIFSASKVTSLFSQLTYTETEPHCPLSKTEVTVLYIPSQ